jgi:hypothetical protein
MHTSQTGECTDWRIACRAGARCRAGPEPGIAGSAEDSIPGAQLQPKTVVVIMDWLRCDPCPCDHEFVTSRLSRGQHYALILFPNFVSFSSTTWYLYLSAVHQEEMLF